MSGPDQIAGDLALIRLAGDLDIRVEKDVVDSVNAVTLMPGLVGLTVAVAAVTFFGFSGVRCLLMARESAIDRGLELNVASASKRWVRRTLDICELSNAVLSSSSV